MPSYKYRAKSKNGEIVEASLDANTIEDLLDKLEQRSLIPLSYSVDNSANKSGPSFFEKLNNSLLEMQSTVATKDVVFFTRQLATLTSAGVPLVKSINTLADGEKPIFKRILKQVSQDISIGEPLADAMGKHKSAFNSMYVSIITAGEASGNLDFVLDQLSTYLERSESMKIKITSAMRYPKFIGIFVTLMMIGAMLKLVPIFEEMYSGMGAELPAPTQLLINMSQIVRGNIVAVVLLLIAIVVAFKVLVKTEKGRYAWDMFLISVPIFGVLNTKGLLARMARTLSMLIESGTPIVQSLELIQGVMDNKIYGATITSTVENIKTGGTLSTSLAATKRYPNLIIQLIATGEESGNIGDLIKKAAEFYEQEVDSMVDSFASIIEPLIIIVLGGVVGGMMIALYLPIFSSGGNM